MSKLKSYLLVMSFALAIGSLLGVATEAREVDSDTNLTSALVETSDDATLSGASGKNHQKGSTQKTTKKRRKKKTTKGTTTGKKKTTKKRRKKKTTTGTTTGTKKTTKKRKKAPKRPSKKGRPSAPKKVTEKKEDVTPPPPPPPALPEETALKKRIREREERLRREGKTGAITVEQLQEQKKKLKKVVKDIAAKTGTLQAALIGDIMSGNKISALGTLRQAGNSPAKAEEIYNEYRKAHGK